MGYYVNNSANLLDANQALMQSWFQGNNAATPLDGSQYRFSGNTTIQHLPLTPIAGYLPVLKNQSYTVGITRVSGTGTLLFGVRAYYLDDNTTFATGTQVSNSAAGRVTYTFTTPTDDRPKGVELFATLSTGYASGTPLILRGATMVYGVTDLGELTPQYFDTDSSGSLDMRVALYVPNGERSRTLTGADEIQASFTLSDVGAMTFSYNPNLPDWAAIGTATHTECAIEISMDGINWIEPLGGRFYRNNIDNDKSAFVSPGKLSFVSWGWMLNKICMNAVATLNDQGSRNFNAVTPGTILKTILDEEKAAGVMTAMNYDFDTATDSNGTPWTNTLTISYTPGSSLAGILRGLVDQGLVDWTTQGRTLRVFNANQTMSRDLSTAVVYKLGNEIIGAPDKIANEGLISRTVGYGDKNARVALTNAGAITPYGHFESSSTFSGVADTGTITVLQQAALDAGSALLKQKTRQMSWAKAQRFPFFHFRPGDKIATYTDENQTTPEVDRVQTITLTYQKDKNVGGSLILNTRIEEWQVKLAKKQASLTGGRALSGSGQQPAPNYPGQDTRTPKAPVGITGNSAAYQDINGSNYAAIALDWADVTQATDNTAMTINAYDVQYRPKNTITPEEFRFITQVMNPGAVTQSQVTMSPFEVGRTYEFRIRALSSTSSSTGLWSAIYEITAAKDNTPPPVPTAPVLSTRGGVVSITWDGKGVGNVPMPIDFSYLQIEMADNSTFTLNLTAVDQLFWAGTSVVAGLPYNVTRFFRFKAIDNSKNESAYSASSNISTAALVSADFIGRVIDNANLVLGSVNASIIADDAVTTPKIKAGSIVGSKLAIGGTNRLVDPHFVNTVLNTLRLATQTPASGFCTISPASSTNTTGYIQIAPTTATAVEMFMNENAATSEGLYPIEMIDGEKYLFEVAYTRVSGTNTGGMRVTCLMNNGTTSQTTVIAIDAATATGILSGVFTAPAGCVAARVSFFVGAAISSQRFANPGVFLQAGATLIEDGAITTNKIVANAVTTAQIAALAVTANEIAANAITTDKINAAAIETVHLKASAIDGMRIVGAEFRTTYAVTGTRMVMYNQGLIARNAANALTLNFDVATGDTMITGVIRTNPQGTYPWIELNNALWPSNYLGVRFYVVSAHAVAPEVSGYRTATDGWIAGSIVMRSGAQAASGTDVVTAGRAEVILQPGGRWLIGQRLGTAYGRNYVTNTGPPGQGGSDETWVAGFGGVLLRSPGAVKVYLDNTAGTTQTLMTQWGAGSIQLIHNTMIELNDGGGAALRTGGGVVEVFRWIRYGSPPASTSGTQFIRVGDLIGIVSSLSKDKLNQTEIPINYKILELTPKTWRDRYQVAERPSTTTRVAGFVAEDVRALSTANGGIFDPLLLFTATGALQGLQYDRVMAYLIPVVRDMADRITELEAKVLELTTPPSPPPTEEVTS